MKTAIKEEADPQHQHALQLHNRVRVFYVCVYYEANIQIAKTEALLKVKKTACCRFLFTP